MISRIDLFKMMFYTLDDVYDETKNEELGKFLSSANPFLFEGEGSADPSIYNEFCKNIISIDEDDYGYDNVFSYLKQVEEGKFVRFFLTKTKSEWIDAFKVYFSEK